MGYLRLWLAIGVMFFHFGLPQPLRATDGGAAVRGFYVLSGYVIAMILKGRYKGRLSLYVKLRLLRIYPVYWAALGLVFAAWVLVSFGWHQPRGPLYLMQAQGLGLGSSAALAAQQVLLLGMDFSGGALHAGGLPWFHYLLLPHAGTLSVELFFYLLAPWLIGLRGRWLGLAALGSLALRWVDPLGDTLFAFFATELGYFCLGLLVYGWQEEWHPAPGRIQVLALLAVALVIAAPYLGGTGVQNLLVPLGSALAAPLLHRLGAHWRGDRVAGELSYSLYLIHPVTGLALAMGLHWAGPWMRMSLLFLGCLAAATLFWALVDRPFEKLRKRISLQSS